MEHKANGTTISVSRAGAQDQRQINGVLDVHAAVAKAASKLPNRQQVEASKSAVGTAAARNNEVNGRSQPESNAHTSSPSDSTSSSGSDSSDSDSSSSSDSSTSSDGGSSDESTISSGPVESDSKRNEVPDHTQLDSSQQRRTCDNRSHSRSHSRRRVDNRSRSRSGSRHASRSRGRSRSHIRRRSNIRSTTRSSSRSHSRRRSYSRSRDRDMSRYRDRNRDGYRRGSDSSRYDDRHRYHSRSRSRDRRYDMRSDSYRQSGAPYRQWNSRDRDSSSNGNRYNSSRYDTNTRYNNRNRYADDRGSSQQRRDAGARTGNQAAHSYSRSASRQQQEQRRVSSRSRSRHRDGSKSRSPVRRSVFERLGSSGQQHIKDNRSQDDDRKEDLRVQHVSCNVEREESKSGHQQQQREQCEQQQPQQQPQQQQQAEDEQQEQCEQQQQQQLQQPEQQQREQQQAGGRQLHELEEQQQRQQADTQQAQEPEQQKQQQEVQQEVCEGQPRTSVFDRLSIIRPNKFVIKTPQRQRPQLRQNLFQAALQQLTADKAPKLPGACRRSSAAAAGTQQTKTAATPTAADAAAGAAAVSAGQPDHPGDGDKLAAAQQATAAVAVPAHSVKGSSLQQVPGSGAAVAAAKPQEHNVSQTVDDACVAKVITHQQQPSEDTEVAVAATGPADKHTPHCEQPTADTGDRQRLTQQQKSEAVVEQAIEQQQQSAEVVAATAEQQQPAPEDESKGATKEQQQQQQHPQDAAEAILAPAAAVGNKEQGNRDTGATPSSSGKSDQREQHERVRHSSPSQIVSQHEHQQQHSPRDHDSRADRYHSGSRQAVDRSPGRYRDVQNHCSVQSHFEDAGHERQQYRRHDSDSDSYRNSYRYRIDSRDADRQYRRNSRDADKQYRHDSRIADGLRGRSAERLGAAEPRQSDPRRSSTERESRDGSRRESREDSRYSARSDSRRGCERHDDDYDHRRYRRHQQEDRREVSRDHVNQQLPHTEHRQEQQQREHRQQQDERHADSREQQQGQPDYMLQQQHPERVNHDDGQQQQHWKHEDDRQQPQRHHAGHCHPDDLREQREQQQQLPTGSLHQQQQEITKVTWVDNIHDSQRPGSSKQDWQQQPHQHQQQQQQQQRRHDEQRQCEPKQPDHPVVHPAPGTLHRSQQVTSHDHAVSGAPTRPASAKTGLVIKIGANRHKSTPTSTPTPPAAATAANLQSPGAQQPPALPLPVAHAAVAAGESVAAGCTQLFAKNQQQQPSAASSVGPTMVDQHGQQQQQQLISPTGSYAQQQQQHWQEQQEPPPGDQISAANVLVAEASAQCEAGLQPVMTAYQQLLNLRQQVADEQALTHRVLQRTSERCWAFALKQADGILDWDFGLHGELYLLEEIQNHFPTGFDSAGQLVCVCFDAGEHFDFIEPRCHHPTWPPLSDHDEDWTGAERRNHWQMMSLIEAVVNCTGEQQQQEQELQQQAKEIQQHLNVLLTAMDQLRTHVKNLALATTAQQTAIHYSHPWLWINEPGQHNLSSSRKGASWQQLQQNITTQLADITYDPAHIRLQLLVPNVETAETTLLQVQQNMAALQAQLGRLSSGFVHISSILKELPSFDDCTACWVLSGGTVPPFGAAAAAAALSIDQLRLLVHQQSITPLALVSHVCDKSKVVWVLDLVMLKAVDSQYGDMQQEQQVNMHIHQQQHEQYYQQRQQQPLWRTQALLQSPRRRLDPRLQLQQQQQGSELQRQLSGSKQSPSVPTAAGAAAVIKTPSPDGPPAPPTPPVDEPAAAAATTTAAEAPAEATQSTSAAAVLPSCMHNHAPRSVLAVIFPFEVAAPFAWPPKARRARRLLRRFFEGCDEEWDALPSDDEAEQPLRATQAVAAVTNQEAKRAAEADQPAVKKQQQQQLDVGHDNSAAEPGAAAGGAAAAVEEGQQGVSSSKRKGRRRSHQPKSSDVEGYLANVDPETAAAIRELVYGLRRTSRTSAAGTDQQQQQQQKSRKRHVPDNAAIDAAVADSKRVRSRSSTPALSASAAESQEAAPSSSAVSDAAGAPAEVANVEMSLQQHLQHLNSSDDIDAETKAAIQAVMLGLRRPRTKQQQQKSTAADAPAPEVEYVQASSRQQQHKAKTKRSAALSSSKAAMEAAASSKQPAKKRRRSSSTARSVPLSARCMTVEQMRDAAADKKKPGFSQGMHQALMTRQHQLTAKGAAEGLPTDDQGFVVVLPYSLPMCLLNYNPLYDTGKQTAAANSMGRSRRAGQIASSSINDPSAAAGAGTSAATTSSRRGQRFQMRSIMRAGDVGLSEAVKWKNLVAKSKKVVFQRSGVHGWGLFAAEAIQPEEFVIEYVGELIRPVLEDLREKYYESQGQDSSYLFRIDGDWVADATVRGGLARFINHSCDPNCYTKIFEVEGTRKIGIYAKKQIAPGQELAYDYKFEFEEGERKVPCACGAKNCRGFMN